MSRDLLHEISDQYHSWIERQAKLWHAPVLNDPKVRRDEFVEPYFRQAQPEDIVAIIKAREPSRILVSIGADDRWHLEYSRRWVIHYNIYLNDSRWGRMFVRMC